METTSGNRDSAKKLLRNSSSQHRRLKPAAPVNSNLWVPGIQLEQKNLNNNMYLSKDVVNQGTFVTGREQLAAGGEMRVGLPPQQNNGRLRVERQVGNRPNIPMAGGARPSPAARAGSGVRSSKQDASRSLLSPAQAGFSPRMQTLNQTSGPNVFNRLTSGVAGMNGSPSKIQILDHTQQEGILKIPQPPPQSKTPLNLSKASAKGFRRSLNRERATIQSPSNGSENSKEDKDRMKSPFRYEKVFKGEDAIKQFAETITITNQAQTPDISRTQKPPKTMKPPRLPMTTTNAALNKSTNLAAPNDGQFPQDLLDKAPATSMNKTVLQEAKEKPDFISSRPSNFYGLRARSFNRSKKDLNASLNASGSRNGFKDLMQAVSQAKESTDNILTSFDNEAAKHRASKHRNRSYNRTQQNDNSLEKPSRPQTQHRFVNDSKSVVQEESEYKIMRTLKPPGKEHPDNEMMMSLKPPRKEEQKADEGSQRRKLPALRPNQTFIVTNTSVQDASESQSKRNSRSRHGFSRMNSKEKQELDNQSLEDPLITEPKVKRESNTMLKSFDYQAKKVDHSIEQFISSGIPPLRQQNNLMSDEQMSLNESGRMVLPQIRDDSRDIKTAHEGAKGFRRRRVSTKTGNNNHGQAMDQSLTQPEHSQPQNRPTKGNDDAENSIELGSKSLPSDFTIENQKLEKTKNLTGNDKSRTDLSQYLENIIDQEDRAINKSSNLVNQTNPQSLDYKEMDSYQFKDSGNDMKGSFEQRNSDQKLDEYRLAEKKDFLKSQTFDHSRQLERQEPGQHEEQRLSVEEKPDLRKPVEVPRTMQANSVNQQNASLTTNPSATFGNQKQTMSRPPLSVKKGESRLSVTGKYQPRGRQPAHHQRQVGDSDQLGNELQSTAVATSNNRLSPSGASAKVDSQQTREGSLVPCARPFADGQLEPHADKSVEHNSNRQLPAKNLSLNPNDIILESEILDIAKIRSAIAYDHFLRLQVKQIKKSRSRSKGAAQSTAGGEDGPGLRRKLSNMGEGSPLRMAAGGIMGQSIQKDVAKMPSGQSVTEQSEADELVENWVQKKFGDESIYIGQLNRASDRHGYGVMKYANGRQYEGQWKDDLRVGEGFERYQNGNMYSGKFVRGKAHGHGVYTWSNGEVYDGEWFKGNKQGHGLWKGVKGDSYVGEWFSSKSHGYGVHVYPNGDRYEGEWKMGLKHGTGSDMFATGDTYVGDFNNGKMHGKGVYKCANGQSYNGEYQNGLRHGKGQWRSSENLTQCNFYEGDWKQDKKHGHGVFNWISGNVYKGEYFEDERHGQGRMEWTDGSVYEGEWKHGIQHGWGKMTYPDGKVREGIFEDNIFRGEVSESQRESMMQSAQEDEEEDSDGSNSRPRRKRLMAEGLDFHHQSIEDLGPNQDDEEDDHVDVSDNLSRDIEVRSGKRAGTHEASDYSAKDRTQDSFFGKDAPNNKLSAQAKALQALKRGPNAEERPARRKQAGTAIQDQIQFQDQSEDDDDESYSDINLRRSRQHQDAATHDRNREKELSDWNDDESIQRVKVPEEAQRDYDDKIEQLKRRLDPEYEPRPSVCERSRERNNGEAGSVKDPKDGSQSPQDSKRQDDSANLDEARMKMIRDAIIKERSETRKKRTAKSGKADNDESQQSQQSAEKYDKEHLVEWGYYYDNF